MNIGSDPKKDAGEAFDGFLDKWRAYWPEWHVAQVFVPPAQRIVSVAWFALLQELAEAAWGGSEAAPGAAKLAWWQDEMRGWSKGARRHPLGEVLQKRSAAWAALADALPSLMASRDHVLAALPLDALLPRLMHFDTVVLQCEATLFDRENKREDQPHAGVSWIALLLAHSLLKGGDRVQLHESSDALAAVVASPGAVTLSRPRRIYHALLLQRARMQLRQKATESQAVIVPTSSWRTVWVAWQAARDRNAD